MKFKAVTLTVILAGSLAACGTSKPQATATAHQNYEYVISTAPNIALYAAFNANGKTYLEFLEAKRMNPVVTQVDGVPMEYEWDDRYVVLNGVFDNLTVTTPHGVAHVYAKKEAPPTRVTARTPPRALEYGVEVPLVKPPVADNYGTSELPATGEALEPDRISVPVEHSFSSSISQAQAGQLVNAGREASRITISAVVPERGKRVELHAHEQISEARQFLVDNGVPAYKIHVAQITTALSQAKPSKTSKVAYKAAPTQVNILIAR